MKNSNESQEVTDLTETESSSYVEALFKGVIQSYEEGTNNREGGVEEVRFQLTLTTHKIPMQDGNKDVAYLRLERHKRTKGTEEDFIPQLLHQEMYIFQNLKERLNPKSRWKEKLYEAFVARMMMAGIEWGAFLLKAKERGEIKTPPTDEERLEKLGLVKADAMPAPLSEDDKKYVEHIKAERAKEGIE